MTSNLGARIITDKKSLGFSSNNNEEKVSEKKYEETKKDVMEVVKKELRPEFINRIDEIIVFHKLEDKEIYQIIDLMLAEVTNRLKNEKYNIVIKKKKKAKFIKQEIDDIILAYIKGGNSIPKVAKDLVKLGLPSRDVIMRYYKDWHEPFILYSKLYEKIN